VARAREAADQELERLEHLGDAHGARPEDRAPQVAQLAPLELRDLANAPHVEAEVGEGRDLALEPEPRHDQQRELILDRRDGLLDVPLAR